MAEGEFYKTDGKGNIQFLKKHTGWRGSWSIIVPGNFGGNKFTGLLFYDPMVGEGEFYKTDGKGNIPATEEAHRMAQDLEYHRTRKLWRQ